MVWEPSTAWRGQEHWLQHGLCWRAQVASPSSQTWHQHPQTQQPASSRSAPNRNGWQLVFSQAFGTTEATASFYFVVPMISLVDCNQQNFSRCGSKGWSQPGGSEHACVSWLHVSQCALKMFAFKNSCTRANCFFLAMRSVDRHLGSKAQRRRKSWHGHKEKPESCIQCAQNHPNPGWGGADRSVNMHLW